MEWTQDNVLSFLELYQKHPCLWNPKNKHNKNRAHASDAWNDISKNLAIPCTIQQLKMKKESLMTSYRSYKAKERRSIASGGGLMSEVYQATWFAYGLMDSFLGPIYENKQYTKAEYEEYGEDSNTELDNDAAEYLASETELNEEWPEQQATSQQESSRRVTTRNKRKYHLRSPPEIHLAKKQMDQAYEFMRYVSEQQQRLYEEDECDLFGKLLAKKLRKLTDEGRDSLMYKINKLMHEE